MVRDEGGKGEPPHPLGTRHGRSPSRGICGRTYVSAMASVPTEIRLTLSASRRFEAIDVNEKIASDAGDLLQRYRRTIYCSLHTTAGYLNQSLAQRMHHHHGRLARFFDAWNAVFPPDAEYSHDQMDLRSEL